MERAPVAYHCDDFSFEEHRVAVEAKLWDQARERRQASTPAEQALAWTAFHKRHTQFFKPRRYLLQAFPQLAAGGGILILEVGCGDGASALAVLAADATARVVAVDFAPTAVAAAEAAAVHAGVSSRFCALCADPSSLSPEAFCAALAAATLAAGWAGVTCFDAVLAVFVLSALGEPQLSPFIASISRVLRPGGALLVRDYGIYDLAHLRFLRSQQSSPVFTRADSTLARFFCTDELARCVIDAAGSVVLCQEELKYCCVRVPNRAKGIEMRRVFVHAVFRREP